jgi:hypothetical protein
MSYDASIYRRRWQITAITNDAETTSYSYTKVKTQKDQSASRSLANSAGRIRAVDDESGRFAIFNSENSKRPGVSSKIGTIERWPELRHRLDRIFLTSHGRQLCWLLR